MLNRFLRYRELCSVSGFSILLIIFVFSTVAVAQVENTGVSLSQDNEQLITDTTSLNNAQDLQSYDGNEAVEDDIDLESEIVEPETEDAEIAVDIVNNILEIIADLEGNDTIERHYAIYNTDPAIVDYDAMLDTAMVQKFDVLQGEDNEQYRFTFIRQTIYNANRQAWDFVYERIYNQDGKLISFVRRYNTYDSGCAEVAFERSEYYYNDKGNLAKKTYQIFDSNNNPLQLEDCWMQRESYEKYNTLTEFISQYPIQL